MKNIVSFLLVVLLSVFNFTQGQVNPDSTQLEALKNFRERMNNNLGVNWNEKTGTPDIITFSNPYSFATEPTTSARLFLKEIKNLLRKKDIEDNLNLQRIIQTDSIKHIRFGQYYKNVPVQGGEYVISVLPGGKVQSALGKFHKNISISILPVLTENQALVIAIQNPPENYDLKDSLILYRLIVLPKGNEYFLAWELEIPSYQNDEHWIYTIDASNGTILNSRSSSINEIIELLLPQSQANIFMRHPFLDPNYSYVVHP